MEFQGFPDEAFGFYAGLEQDNSRDYWHRHKQTYETCVREPMEALAEALGERYGQVRVARPQRDLRFSKDKSPYKTYQGLTAGSAESIGYYLQLEAEALRLGGGFHGQAADQLERFRNAIDDHRSGAALQRVVDGLTGEGWQLVGERLKTRPRGFPADHPRLELLRYRSLGAEVSYEPGPRLSGPGALDLVRETWDRLRPLVDWLDRHVAEGGN